ncbi:ATP-grasp domain-containing protein [Waddlia chondrophila]|uniref:ATP-grasp fold PylC-type domain-containing protein n=1 Tax=Waddlia chondrophila (strain ATCC VR-1470 / WSU 86-1044) TaxID=716544 RepID=D6YTY5_WADCW|nr:ATP-grasp domain-containing protein [Waddlia chondrophila]ADI37596.1 hypothetical protein wcw_0221 [Waddlia chondrophila WSU 86-1044]
MKSPWPYQIIHSVLQAVKKINTDKVGIAKTYLVKGNIREIKSRLDKQYIVKSCSSMRSIAATEQDYNSWEMQDLKNVPVMFQEYIDGTDYRIHFMDDYTWTLSVISKDRADYRYSSKHSLEYRLETIPSELDDFCKDLSKIEDNRFIGVDLIKTGDRYVCLESNPGPDWSTFYHPSRDQFNHFFIQTLAQEEKGYHV